MTTDKADTSTATVEGVLNTLVYEDRPWTVDEVIRAHGERMEVEDALVELHAVGLVNRIGERVVCASRAAIRADQLRI
jgi:hypothetical protein